MEHHDVETRHGGRPQGPVAASTRAQAHRAMATVRDVLGRDPKSNVFVGGTRLIEREETKTETPVRLAP